MLFSGKRAGWVKSVLGLTLAAQIGFSAAIPRQADAIVLGASMATGGTIWMVAANDLDGLKSGMILMGSGLIFGFIPFVARPLGINVFELPALAITLNGDQASALPSLNEISLSEGRKQGLDREEVKLYNRIYRRVLREVVEGGVALKDMKWNPEARTLELTDLTELDQYVKRWADEGVTLEKLTEFYFWYVARAYQKK